MWKYVTRQFRDQARHDCPLRKKFTGCREGRVGGSNAGDDNKCTNNHPKNWAAIQAARIIENDLQQDCKYTSYEDFREKLRREIRFPNGLLGALTWSSALLAGLVATKLMCYHRRRLGWQSHSCYTRAFLAPSREIHTNVLSYVALAAPHPPAQVYPYEEYFPAAKSEGKGEAPHDFGINFEALKHQLLTEINNEHQRGVKETTAIKDAELINDGEQKKLTVDSAVQSLMTVLGDIEFQMGVQNMAVGQYKTAVSHLKLATSHQHASATYNLGLCYEHGLGVQRDMKMAMECYTAASAVGHPKALYNLGVFYAHGLGGLRRNRRVARQCFVDSAKLGQREAKQALGIPLTEEEALAPPEPDYTKNPMKHVKLAMA